MRSERQFVVLGGVGVIGRTVVRDLFESDRRNRILIADFNEPRARALARTFRSRRVTAAFADATRPVDLAQRLRGWSVVINCTQHDFNLRVMDAACRARVHYVDLGGLFHWTRQQLKRHPRFKRAGLTAVLGMGCAPGITNVLARHAADQLERVTSLKIRVGTHDRQAGDDDFYFPYSAQTIVEELTLAPWVFAGGKFRQVKPRTGWEQMTFPPPMGTVWLVRTRHSEIATLPVTLRNKGLRACDFKVCFDRAFVREVMRRLRAGWSVQQLAALPTPRRVPDDDEVARVVAAGGGRTLIIDCQARSNPRWRASAGDVDTGCPPSIVAQMIVAGQIRRRGVFPPETVVPVDPFVHELQQRGMTIRCRPMK